MSKVEEIQTKLAFLNNRNNKNVNNYYQMDLVKKYITDPTVDYGYCSIRVDYEKLNDYHAVKAEKILLNEQLKQAIKEERQQQFYNLTNVNFKITKCGKMFEGRMPDSTWYEFHLKFEDRFEYLLRVTPDGVYYITNQKRILYDKLPIPVQTVVNMIEKDYKSVYNLFC